MATKVREATLDDVSRIVELGIAMHAEAPHYNAMAFSPRKVEILARHLLTGTMTTKPTGGVFVAERDGVIIGMVAGLVTELWLSEERILSDYVIFVHADHRGGSAGPRLVRALEEWGRENGARYSMLNISTGVNTERTVELFGKLGYRPHARALIKEL